MCLCATLAISMSAVAETYYVATTGSDDNTGTAERPFASLARAETVVEPGDTVVIEDGLHYLGRRGLKIERAGEPDKPITYRARHPGRAVLRCSEQVTVFEHYQGRLWRARLDKHPSSAYEEGDALHRRWEHKFDGPDDPRIQRGHWQWFDGWLYVWCWEDDNPNEHEVHVAFDSAVTLVGSTSHRVFDGLVFEHGYFGLKWASADAKHHVVRNCLFRHSAMGIGGGSHSLIEHCTFYNIGPSKFEHGIYNGQERTTIRYCHFERISGGALHLYKRPKDLTVHHNTIGPPKRKRVTDPTFAGMHVGIYAWGRGGHQVHHNVIYGGHRVGISLFAPDSIVAHNTIVGTTRWGLLLLKGMHGNRVVNNFVAADAGLFTACGVPWSQQLDYNLYAGPAKWSWGGAGHKGGRQVDTLDAWRHLSGQASHSALVADAGFLDADQHDYRLTPASPALASGVPLDRLPGAHRGVTPAIGAFADGGPWPKNTGVSFTWR